MGCQKSSDIAKYFSLRRYANYYNKNGKMKGITIRSLNRIFKYLLLFKRLDKTIIKGVTILAKALNVKDKQMRKYALGRYYLKKRYQMNMHNQPRKYIPSDVGIENFFRELNKRKVDYIVFCGLENFPAFSPGEGIDMIIRDEDAGRITDLFSHAPQGIPVNAYTLMGKHGWAYGIAGPYFLPVLGENMLRNKILYKNAYYIPAVDDCFLGTLYHVTYHISEQSGLAIDDERESAYKDKEYGCLRWIESFSQQSNIDGSINLYKLHTYLKSWNLSPGVDTLRKLYMMNKSEFLYEISEHCHDAAIGTHDMIVFIVREWAIEQNLLIDIINALRASNLDIISYYFLTESDKKRAVSMIRGGEWGKGPYPVSGGLPQLAIVVFDYHPKQASTSTKRNYPFVQNENVLIKHKIRDRINNKFFITKWANFIHSSDDYREAREYISIICPHLSDYIMAKVKSRVQSYETYEKVIRVLPSNNTRSKTELIEYNGNCAVKKTFKSGRERFLQREIFAYKELSKKIPYIPKLLDYGPSYIIIPYYHSILKDKKDKEKRRILRDHKKEILEFLQLLFEEGYAVIDFYPSNVMVTEDNHMVVIDYEFLYRYPAKPKDYRKSYDIAGIPKGFDGDLPKGMIYPGRTYKNTWRRLLGTLE